MKKVLVTLSLVGFLSQPVLAQCPVTQPCLPTGAAACTTPTTQLCIPTGAAASVAPTVQPVKIPKKRWWQRSRTGYMPVCPGVTGAAASICNPCAGITGGAAAVSSSVEPVMVPKKHFWEKDNVQMMQISPAVTGFAAPCPGVTPCPTTTGAACPVTPCVPCNPCPTTTGAACPVTPCVPCNPCNPCTTGGASAIGVGAPVTKAPCDPCATSNPCATGGAAQLPTATPIGITGGAARIYPVGVVPCVPTGAACPISSPCPEPQFQQITPQVKPAQTPVKTGGAAPTRGYW